MAHKLSEAQRDGEYPLPGHYDDHCWLTFLGRNWHIITESAGRFLNLQSGRERVVLDIGHVHWRGYYVAAATMMAGRLALAESKAPQDNEEGSR